MKKSIFGALTKSASVAAVTAAMLVGISTSAFAASTVGTPITTTSTNENVYGSTTNSTKTIQAVLGYNSDSLELVYLADHTSVTVTDTNGLLNGPMFAVWSKDNSKLYIPNYGDDQIVVVDVATKTVTGSFTGANSEGINGIVSPDGSKLIVTDNYGNVTAYDLTDNYAELWSSATTDPYVVNLYSTDATHVLLVGMGYLETLDITTGVVSDTRSVSNGDYGFCINSDSSVLATSDGGSSVYLINTATGATTTSADLGAQSISGCEFTNKGQLVVADWSYSNSGTGHIYILDASTLSILETLETPNVEYTTGVNIMKNCETFVAGYNANVAVVTLDSAYCTPIEDTAAPVLAATGTDSGATTWLAFGMLVAGALAAFATRRKTA